MLLDRLSERAALRRLLEAARGGRSGILVVRGMSGVGKTALLEDLIGSAAGFAVVRTVGVESEMELAFASLQQLCGPMLDQLDRLPGPQRDALGVAFGQAAGAAPEEFLVGLAALSLLSQVAGERPLLCVIDDAQWLDRASAQALGFVARRLLAEPVALLVAAREPVGEFAGLPELAVGNLAEGDARELLGSAVMGPLDEGVRDRIVAEAEGNPLALLELPRALTPAELAGGYWPPGGVEGPLPVPGMAGAGLARGPDRIEDSFVRRLQVLPAGTRRLLLVAAAEPAGDAVLVWRAAGQLGIGLEAAAAAEAGGLLTIGERVTFRHPLVRSAVYQAALPAERRVVHRALADATDPGSDPDRRAWHHAHATLEPDEDVAAELESSAGRAQARGGLAAAAAFLERSAVLTLDRPRRAERVLAAAQAKYQAGASDAALGLLAVAEAGPLGEVGRARAGLLRGQIAWASRSGSEAPLLLLTAARQLEPHDARLARDTYLDALFAALFVGRLASGVGMREVAEAARAAPGPEPARAPDLLLDGLAVLITEGFPAAAAPLQQAVSAFRGAPVSGQEVRHWLWPATHVVRDVWDYDNWDALSARQVRLAREAGALIELGSALTTRALMLLLAGEFTVAASMVAESESAIAATGSSIEPYGALALAALRGSEAEAFDLVETCTKDVECRGQGAGLGLIQWETAVLCNGLGRYEQALAAAQQASQDAPVQWYANWALAELVEAATHGGAPEHATDALRRLAPVTSACGTDWALGIEARSRALVSDGRDAENLYREAIDRLGRTRLRVDLGRARLLYGEWLRRRRRRLEARDQLRGAHDFFDSIGAEAFAQRARIELRATGEHARKRTVETRDALTAQEALIARLAGEGASNAQIAAQLFISSATVAYHLGKVFSKLGISSRHQLARALATQRAPESRVTAQT
jgi:DNA-binding CsgD family transcriptional regulator